MDFTFPLGEKMVPVTSAAAVLEWTARSVFSAEEPSVGEAFARPRFLKTEVKKDTNNGYHGLEAFFLNLFCESRGQRRACGLDTGSCS